MIAFRVAEDVGVEPTDELPRHGLANRCLSRSAYPPTLTCDEGGGRGEMMCFAPESLLPAEGARFELARRLPP